jgi:hypothetical protein
MEDHTKGQAPGTSNKFSTLDWPSPEILRAAHRARAKVVRDMTLDLCRRLKSLALRPFAPFRSCREHPTQQPGPDSLSRATREALARTWLEN